MTTELDTIDDQGTIDLLPPKRQIVKEARVALAEDAEMMQHAYQIAKGVCGDGRNGTGLLVPQRFRGKPEEGAAAIIFGAELGLRALQAMQRVIPIHGMPSIEARTMVALVKARGYKVKTVAQSDDSVTVRGTDLDGDTYESTWTLDRAKRAGYVPTPSSPESKCRPDVDSDWVTVEKIWDGKKKVSIVGNMKYITDPQAMLKAKAQAEVCREIAPDVLIGIPYSREELESERWDGTVSVEPPRRQQSRPVTEDEIFGEEVPVPGQGGGNDVGDGAEPSSGADLVSPPRDQDAADAAAPETPAGADDQDSAPVTADPEPAPAEPTPEKPAENIPESIPAQNDSQAPKKAPAKKATARDASKYRAGLEKRLFTLLADAQISDREDRITIYRAVLERPDITSTNDLDDVEVTKVGDQLYRWQTEKVTEERLTDIFNAAVLAAENAAAADTTTTEGK